MSSLREELITYLSSVSTIVPDTAKSSVNVVERISKWGEPGNVLVRPDLGCLVLDRLSGGGPLAWA